MTAYVTIAHDPGLGTIIATSPDRLAAQALERAGFVRDSSTGLHRLRRDTPLSVGQRMVRDATRLLNPADYGVLRLYSEQERQRQVTQDPPDEVPAVQSTGPGTIWTHHVSADIAAGHLVIHARHTGAHGETELLGSYPADGSGATFYTEGGGYYGVSHHAEFAAAAAEFGFPLEVPKQGGGRAAAAVATSRNATRPAPGALPVSAASTSAPTVSASSRTQPF